MISKAKAASQWGLTFVAASLLVTAAAGVSARAPHGGDAGAVVALNALPPEARQTHHLILAGGPFPYAKDGSTLFNRERQLPARPRGQYREYTVQTAGSRDRGARRIVCGGRVLAAPEVCFYTADHYNSFSRITP